MIAGSTGSGKSELLTTLILALAVRYDRRPGDPILQVRTPTALVRVIGTVFTVSVDELGNTTVGVLRGKVEVVDPENGRPLASVAAGFRYDVGAESYRDVGRREVAAALPISEQGELSVAISISGERHGSTCRQSSR